MNGAPPVRNGAHSGTRYGKAGFPTARAYSPLRNSHFHVSCLLLSVSLSISFVTARHRTCQRDGGYEISATGRPTDPCPRARKPRHLIKVPKTFSKIAVGVFMAPSHLERAKNKAHVIRQGRQLGNLEDFCLSVAVRAFVPSLYHTFSRLSRKKSCELSKKRDFLRIFSQNSESII